MVYGTVTAITQLGADIDGEAAGDESGWSVAMNSDGTIVAVGAVYNDATGTNAGHVRVYQLSSNSWSQLGNDFDGEAAGDMSGISVALSSDGSILAVGAWYNSDGGSYAGQVRVFQWSSGSWAQLGSDIDGGSGIQTLGRSVALSSDGTVLATGAIYNSNPPNNAGVVRVLLFSSYSWTQLGSDIVGEAADDISGGSVSLNSDGTIVAIGAQYNDGTGSNAGHVRVHQFSSGSWTQLGGDIDGEAASDEFGQTVSLNSDGTILAVGTQLNDGNGANAGHVQVYQFSSGSWTQLGADIDGEAAGDKSGTSVSLSWDGTILAVGARLNGDNGQYAGHVRVYEWSGGSWTRLIRDLDGEAAGDQFGYAVALSGYANRLVVGGINNDGTASNAGHARVYELADRLSSGPPPPQYAYRAPGLLEEQRQSLAELGWTHGFRADQSWSFVFKVKFLSSSGPNQNYRVMLGGDAWSDNPDVNRAHMTYIEIASQGANKNIDFGWNRGFINGVCCTQIVANFRGGQSGNYLNNVPDNTEYEVAYIRRHALQRRRERRADRREKQWWLQGTE